MRCHLDPCLDDHAQFEWKSLGIVIISAQPATVRHRWLPSIVKKIRRTDAGIIILVTGTNARLKRTPFESQGRPAQACALLSARMLPHSGYGLHGPGDRCRLRDRVLRAGIRVGPRAASARGEVRRRAWSRSLHGFRAHLLRICETLP